MKNSDFIFPVPYLKEAGFTFIETVVAVGIIAVGLSVIFNVAINNLIASETSKNTFIAAFLAQEGYELIRNFRDVNWLQATDTAQWLSSPISLADGNYEVDYNDPAPQTNSSRLLKIDSGGFYNYESGVNSIFKRLVNIKTTGTNQIKVTVTVSWNERGKSKSLTTENLLYNWK